MSDNDYTEFLPLNPDLQLDFYTPEIFAFERDGSFKDAELESILPSDFKRSDALQMFQFETVLPSDFKEEITVSGGGAVATKYRMRGYFVAGTTYEFWITTDPTAANPSGNPLVGKVIDSVLI
jgi:hypothetical protein